MKKNLLKLLIFCLFAGSFTAANAQVPFRYGWPTTFTRAYTDYWQTSGWTLGGDVRTGYVGGKLDVVAVREYSGGTYYNKASYKYVYSGGKNVPDSIIYLLFDNQTNTYVPNRVLVTTYNLQGNLVSEVLKTSVAQEWQNLSRVVYTYDVTGTKRLSGRMDREAGSQGWAKSGEVEYTYDVANRVETETILTDVGDSTYEGTTRQRFIYNGTNLSEIITEEINGSVWEQFTRFRFFEVSGVNEAANAASGMQVYPNPSQGMVKVTLPQVTGNVNAEVYDMIGRKVISLNRSAELSTGTLDIDISSLPAGAYVLRCSNNTQIYTQVINKN